MTLKTLIELFIKYFVLLIIISSFSCSLPAESVSENFSSDPVWNQAYQENWNADSVASILKYAENSYVLLDPFSSSEAADAVPVIKLKNNIVSVYISVGTGEEWRDDFDRIKDSLVSKEWGSWEGEYFVDRITPELISAMKDRINKAAGWGADMVEFDNMDWAFDESARKKYNFHVSVKESLNYVNSLREYAESLGLKCMAKNMTAGAENFAGVTYESSSSNMDWWDHNDLQSFLDKGKLCVIFHYNERHPEKAVNYYKSEYGQNLLILVENRSVKGYLH